ncbi:MAG: Dot/Icm T4SS effector protein kinase CoxK1 [Gammaproteobacteria bacterium]|nr:MAG: Dot/Icm T4SS effector protein kinase CoxK1 [Gammaproteobacteria bacterium]
MHRWIIEYGSSITINNTDLDNPTIVAKNRDDIDTFGFRPGRVLARKYEVLSLLGAGWEGEVYKIREVTTGIERAAKFFFPIRNLRDKSSKFYAKKLHKLRHCPILIQYHHQDSITFKGSIITFLVSDYVEGELLSEYVSHQSGKRVSMFEGLHILYTLTQGMECIHQGREFHGDLHDNNIIIKRHGIGFDIKLLDLYRLGPSGATGINNDVCELIRIFYDILGGQKHYAKHPKIVKDICCGLKRTLILKKFRTAGRLRKYLETLTWS